MLDNMSVFILKMCANFVITVSLSKGKAKKSWLETKLNYTPTVPNK